MILSNFITKHSTTFVIFLLSLFPCIRGQEFKDGIPMASGPHLRGSSIIMPHNFSYEVKDPMYGNYFGHEVVATEMEINGRYYVLLPDGQVLTVNYTADHEGYRPTLDYQPFVKEGMFADFLVGEEAIAQYSHGKGKNKNKNTNKHRKNKDEDVTSTPLTAPPGSLVTMFPIMMGTTTASTLPLSLVETVSALPSVTQQIQTSFSTAAVTQQFQTTFAPVVVSRQSTLSPPAVTSQRVYSTYQNPTQSPNQLDRLIRSTTRPSTDELENQLSISTTESPIKDSISISTPGISLLNNNLERTDIGSQLVTNNAEQILLSVSDRFTPPKVNQMILSRLINKPNLNPESIKNQIQEIQALLPITNNLVDSFRPNSKTTKTSWKPPRTREPLVGGPVRRAKMMGEDDVTPAEAEPTPLVGGPVRKMSDIITKKGTESVEETNQFDTEPTLDMSASPITEQEAEILETVNSTPMTVGETFDEEIASTQTNTKKKNTVVSTPPKNLKKNNEIITSSTDILNLIKSTKSQPIFTQTTPRVLQDETDTEDSTSITNIPMSRKSTEALTNTKRTILPSGPPITIPKTPNLSSIAAILTAKPTENTEAMSPAQSILHKVILANSLNKIDGLSILNKIKAIPNPNMVTHQKDSTKFPNPLDSPFFAAFSR